jgi:hypothetical protein
MKGSCALGQRRLLVGVGRAVDERLVARRTRASMEHGPASECAGSSMIVRLPGQEAEGEIRTLEGPDGPSGFRDRYEGARLQDLLFPCASWCASQQPSVQRAGRREHFPRNEGGPRFESGRLL